MNSIVINHDKQLFPPKFTFYYIDKAVLSLFDILIKEMRSDIYIIALLLTTKTIFVNIFFNKSDTKVTTSLLKKRRPLSQASVARGVIPSDSARISITNAGKMRFKFRKSEVKSTMHIYYVYICFLHCYFTIGLQYCQKLANIQPSIWNTLPESALCVYILFEVKSVSISVIYSNIF
uniref:MSP domain-containing protein n=1 Tax=Heterorhabditis bacteriophora TaxID=37862 RepID=A0A1I7WJP5_HETBA